MSLGMETGLTPMITVLKHLLLNVLRPALMLVLISSIPPKYMEMVKLKDNLEMLSRNLV